MSRHQTTPGTKSGIFNNLLKDQAALNNAIETSNGPTREEFNKFFQEVAQAPLFYKQDDTMPYVEAPLVIIRFYNKTPAALKGFEDTGYFIFQDVKVYLEGNRQKSVDNEKRTIEEIKFPIREAK